MLAQRLHLYFVTDENVSPLTASLAWALMRPYDDAATMVACWWLACKFEETDFSYPAWEGVRTLSVVESVARLRCAGRDVLARIGFVLPYRTTVRALYELLGAGYDAWLFALLEVGVVYLYTAVHWAEMIRGAVMRRSVAPVVQMILCLARKHLRLRLSPRSRALAFRLPSRRTEEKKRKRV